MYQLELCRTKTHDKKIFLLFLSFDKLIIRFLLIINNYNYHSGRHSFKKNSLLYALQVAYHKKNIWQINFLHLLVLKKRSKPAL